MDLILPTPPKRGGAIPLLALAVVSAGAAGLVAAAPAASAATFSPNNQVTCGTLGNLTVTAQQGEAFTLSLTNCTGAVLTYDTSLLSSSVSTGSTLGAQTTTTFTVLDAATPGILFQGAIGFAKAGQNFTSTLSRPSDPSHRRRGSRPTGARRQPRSATPPGTPAGRSG